MGISSTAELQWTVHLPYKIQEMYLSLLFCLYVCINSFINLLPKLCIHLFKKKMYYVVHNTTHNLIVLWIVSVVLC